MTNIILCGCGALGSNIAMAIARERDNIALYDDDKIESINVTTGTTVYSSEHIGQHKSRILARLLARKFGTAVFPSVTTVKKSIEILRPEAELIIDCFDNVEARVMTMPSHMKIPTIHVSIGEQGLGAIEWDDIYQLPQTDYARGENPVCTNELGRDLILFTSTVASIIINKYLSTKTKQSVYVMPNTLEIFK